MDSLNSVVITGLAAITGHGVARHFSDIPALEAAPPVAGPITGFALEAFLESPKTYLDRCSALALAGSAEALRQAGVAWPVAEDAAGAFGIVVGTHLGCVETMRVFWDKAMERGVRVANPLLFSHSYFNSPISLCAIEFGLKGFHTTVCAGAASGLAAVRTAHDAIVLGHAAAMVAGGVEGYTPTRAACEPAADLAEAAVFFVLESAAHAEARDAPLQVPLDDANLVAAETELAKIRQLYGECGGATGALALLHHLAALQNAPD